MDDGIDTTGTIDCFSCGKQLTNWTYGDRLKNGGRAYVAVHPMGGLHFETHGHYGSRIFDPMDGKGTKLDIAICDECLIEKVKRVRGTGFSDLDEIALEENAEYRKEKDDANKELLSFFEESLKELDNG